MTETKKELENMLKTHKEYMKKIIPQTNIKYQDGGIIQKNYFFLQSLYDTERFLEKSLLKN